MAPVFQPRLCYLQHQELRVVRASCEGFLIIYLFLNLVFGLLFHNSFVYSPTLKPSITYRGAGGAIRWWEVLG